MNTELLTDKLESLYFSFIKYLQTRLETELEEGTFTITSKELQEIRSFFVDNSVTRESLEVAKAKWKLEKVTETVDKKRDTPNFTSYSDYMEALSSETTK